MDDIVVSAKLSNGKQIIIKPFDSEALWRYKTQSEIENDTFEVYKNYIWFKSLIMTTTEEFTGIKTIFTNINGDNVMLNRYFE
ncbi:hypothetical protein RVS70_05545 [Virgibacillus sp. M23]|uniref:hypothetical protein n=1 Tax=Virgibacillus sp. M23 TaxID=3079030 RepID=UPI002A91562B|nr:hypothetical protein [Virgibacillus sp. M23]MDY7043666.1 hypothetical protein [Virgibacillus sp. M23]